MKQMDTCVGIDLARRAKHKAVVVCDRNGRRPARKRAFSFAHDRQGFQALRDHLLRETGKASLGGVTVNMEPTSGVWEGVAAYLRAQGATVCFTRTDVVAALRKAHSRHAKSDRIDARTLAAIPQTFPEKLIETTTVPTRVRRLRQLSDQRHRLVEDVTRWKYRLVAKLEPVWNPLLVLLENEQRFCRLARAFFKRFTDPRKVVAMGREKFLAWCRGKAHGNTAAALFDTFWKGATRAAELRDLLDEGDTAPCDWVTSRELLEQDFHLIAMFEKQIDALDARIKDARRDVPETDVAQQLPGVGPVVSVTLASILLPIERFSNAKKCGAYTGFTSRRKSSGDRQIEGLRITKTGNRRLKRDLALAADTAMKQDAELAAFAIGLLGAGKHYNQVRVAVGRKLAVRAYSLFKRHGAGQTDVAYVWRDPLGRTVTKRRSQALAQKLWAEHKAEKKRKGSPPNPARSRQPEGSVKQASNELPRHDHVPITNHKSNPKRTASTWVKLGDIPLKTPQHKTRKKA